MDFVKDQTSLWQALWVGPSRLPFSGNLQQWFAELVAALPDTQPLTLALLGGAQSLTPGLAFLAGYQAALRALNPVAPSSLGALCVSEQRQNHPAAIQCQISAGSLSGQKDFVIGGAEWLWVIGKTDAAFSSLGCAQVQSQAVGVELIQLSALKLMPEVGHARVEFDRAPAQLLPGDGWADYAKPFRTLEDIYVLGAMLAWVLNLARELNWPQTLRLQLFALLSALAPLASLCPNAPTTHVLLAGVLEQWGALRESITQCFAQSPEPWQALWRRDQSVLDLAANARHVRLTKALATLNANRT